MTNTYQVKTRNWESNKIVLRVLIWTKCAGVSLYGDDADVKAYIETPSAIKAWSFWALFMILRHWSGGWTYIVRPGACVDANYKAVY